MTEAEAVRLERLEAALQRLYDQAYLAWKHPWLSQLVSVKTREAEAEVLVLSRAAARAGVR